MEWADAPPPELQNKAWRAAAPGADCPYSGRIEPTPSFHAALRDFCSESVRVVLCERVRGNTGGNHAARRGDGVGARALFFAAAACPPAAAAWPNNAPKPRALALSVSPHPSTSLSRAPRCSPYSTWAACAADGRRLSPDSEIDGPEHFAILGAASQGCRLRPHAPGRPYFGTHAA